MSNYEYKPEAFRLFSITQAWHAPLLSRYKIGYGKCLVGDTKGAYGREDSETGAEYKVVAFEEYRRGERKIVTSTEFECGAFYPETIFIEGFDHKGNSLSFEDLGAFQEEIYIADKPTRRVILPKGHEKGKWTWSNARMYQPGMRPQMYGIEAEILKAFPDAVIDVTSPGKRIEITLGQYEAFPSTNPKLCGDYLVDVFRGSDECADHISEDDLGGIQAHYEHGGWYISVLGSGAQWSVHDIESNGKHSFGFERISQGEDES